MAGWLDEATSRSSKRPNTFGRIASCSNGPTVRAVCSLVAETVKWLHQNSAQRSRKSASVLEASRTRAMKSAPVSSWISLKAAFTGSDFGSPAAAA